MEEFALFDLGTQGTCDTRDTHKTQQTHGAHDRVSVYKRYAAQQKAQEMHSAAWRGYQESIGISERSRADILHMLQAGDDPAHILLTAIRCISAMTGDIPFKDTAEQHMTEKYHVYAK